MRISRRDLSLLLPALAVRADAQQKAPAVRADAQQKAPAARAAAQEKTPVATMKSQAYPSDRIPYKGDDTKRSRQFFLSQTHGGFQVEVHETDLGPGVESHPPHRHVHEEIMIVTAGSLEANMDGVRTTVPTGSVLVFGSNQLHGVRNPGTVTAKYYVIELRGSEA